MGNIVIIMVLYICATPIAFMLAIFSVEEARKHHVSEFTMPERIWCATMATFWPALSFIVIVSAILELYRNRIGR